MGDVLSLMEKAGCDFYVIRGGSGYIAFTVRDASHLLEFNQKTLIHFLLDFDKGFKLEIFEGDKSVCLYEVVFDDEIIIHDDRLDLEYLKKCFEENRKYLSHDEIYKLLHPSDDYRLYEGCVAAQLGRLLGLRHYDWLSYDTMKEEDETY